MSSRSWAVVVVTGAVGGAFACGSFGEGTDPSISVPGPDAGGGPDATAGDDSGAGTDASIGSDAGADARFCEAHGAAFFCTDFDVGEPKAAFDDEDSYGASCTITLAPTAPPDPALLVTMNSVNGDCARHYYKDLTLPQEFSVSVELSASSIGSEHVEFVDLERGTNDTHLTIAFLGGKIQALFEVDGANEKIIDLGYPPTAPTRFTMKLTSTQFIGQRASESPVFVPHDGLGAKFVGLNRLAVGVFYVGSPQGGSFRLDDVLVSK